MDPIGIVAAPDDASGEGPAGEAANRDRPYAILMRRTASALEDGARAVRSAASRNVDAYMWL